MEDRLDKLEKLILAKNKETMDRLDRFLTHNTEAIRRLQEDNYYMKSELQEHVSNNDDDAVDKELEMLKERVNNLESQQENRKYLKEYTQNTDNSVARWFVEST